MTTATASVLSLLDDLAATNDCQTLDAIAKRVSSLAAAMWAARRSGRLACQVYSRNGTILDAIESAAALRCNAVAARLSGNVADALALEAESEAWARNLRRI